MATQGKERRKRIPARVLLAGLCLSLALSACETKAGPEPVQTADPSKQPPVAQQAQEEKLPEKLSVQFEAMVKKILPEPNDKGKSGDLVLRGFQGPAELLHIADLAAANIGEGKLYRFSYKEKALSPEQYRTWKALDQSPLGRPTDCVRFFKLDLEKVEAIEKFDMDLVAVEFR